jgi:hypothetical protein
MELRKCLSFPSLTTAGHKVLASNIESLLECLTKYKETLIKDNFRHQHFLSSMQCSFSFSDVIVGGTW